MRTTMHGRRLLVSPKGLSLAILLHSLTQAGTKPVTVTDPDLGQLLGMAQHTVWAALRELKGLGALTYTEAEDATRTRTVTVDPTRWVWLAVEQELADEAQVGGVA